MLLFSVLSAAYTSVTPMLPDNKSDRSIKYTNICFFIFFIAIVSFLFWYCKVLQSYFSLKPYIFKAFITFANKKAMTPFFRI